jgi:hypothetical protein
MTNQTTTPSQSELPTGARLFVACLAGAVFAASLVALFFAYAHGWGYVIFLLLVFACALSLFHAIFALDVNLQQRSVRKIDYWYLGAACLGLFALALADTGKRADLIEGSKMAYFKINEQRVRRDAQTNLDYYIAGVCAEDNVRYAPDDCPKVRQLFNGRIKEGLSKDQIEELWNEIEQFGQKHEKDVRAAYWKSSEQFDFPNIPFFAWPQNTLRYWENVVVQKPSTEHDTDESILSFTKAGYSLTWPFLLAVALALRITKVTIDVFEWAK